MTLNTFPASGICAHFLILPSDWITIFSGCSTTKQIHSSCIAIRSDLFLVNKRFPVRIVTNNAAPLDLPDNHMMQGSRCVKSRSSRHRTLPFYFARKSGFLLISRYKITAFLATDQRPEVLL